LIDRATAADAGVVIDHLAAVVFIRCFNGLADPDHIGDRTGIGQRIPGAVIANDNAFHGSPSTGCGERWQRGAVQARPHPAPPQQEL
jgi:hypothetical protein